MIKATAILITKENEYPKEVLAPLFFNFDELVVELNCPNIYKRYELALKARNDLIFFKDDDCIIDVDELFKHYNGRITNAITAHHREYYAGRGMTLVGFGAFFPKSMVNFSKYLSRYPIDDLFLSQTDRIFTFLNRPHNTIVMPIKNLESATDSTRMYQQPDHWENLEIINERLLNL
jgi:hypothetical protein